MFSILHNVIKNLIHKDNGPFIIVFWTTNGDQIEAFKKFVNRDDQQEDVARPLSILLLDKTKFDDETLPAALDEIYSNPLVKCLFSFEEELKIASDECLRTILSNIQVNEPWGESVLFSQKFKDLFSKIAILTLGMENGRSNPDKAIKESLMPVFQYSLCNNGNTCWKDYLEFDSISKSHLSKIDINYIAPFLNTIYHIDNNISDNTGRGVVRKILSNENFENRVGYSFKDWAEKRFLKNIEPLKDDYEVIAIECSAACDYANNKNRLHKYILGILCSENDYKNIVSQKNDKTKHIPEYVSPLDFVFIHENNVKSIVLDLNSILSEESCDVFNVLGDAIFQLKHELMNKITSIQTNHSSRIGYSYF